MTRHDAPPLSLLVHDGELADLCALLGDLGTTCTERRGTLSREDRAGHWDVVIATARRMLEVYLDPAPAPPTRIAILDQETRTLRNSLRRAGIQLIVRRPVHPAALRALILHALYRGPEKRRTPRVSVGAPVRFRLGWRQRPAILADLSLGGCRLLSERRIERGKGFTLVVPASVSGQKAFSLKARVMESGPAEGSDGWFMSSRFEKVSQRQLQLLKSTVAAHQSGPAVYASASDARVEAASPRTPSAPSAPAPLPVQPLPVQPRRLQPPLADAEAPEPRESGAHAPEQRMPTPSDEASRVLMGRNISVGGMRVSPNPLLAIGANLQLAVHVGNRADPLVVRARVHRDEGNRGIVLRFYEHTAEVSRYLNDMMDQLPLVDTGDEGDGYLVTEILESA